MKKVASLALASIAWITLLGSGVANSATFWANATVESVLQSETYVSCRLTEENNVFINKLFRIENQRQNAMLAVLLSAKALNVPVRIFFEDGSPAIIKIAGLVTQAN
jgi:hypothetical protein